MLLTDKGIEKVGPDDIDCWFIKPVKMLLGELIEIIDGNDLDQYKIYRDMKNRRECIMMAKICLIDDLVGTLGESLPKMK